MDKIEQGFIVDRLTDSVLNTISGDSFQTDVATLKKSDLRHVTKKKDWKFNWKSDTLGAYHFKNQRMIIATEAAKRLVMKYFKTK
ncbi:MAG: hypothetical protein WD426_11135 [Anditalea sp.]